MSNNFIKECVRRFLPRRIKAHKILSGPLRGELIFTSWHDYPGAIRGTTEKPLIEWFSRHANKGETWLDVGGHYGYTSIALSRLVGSSGRVYTFEPMLSTVGALNQTRGINGMMNMTILPFALGSQGGMHRKQLPYVRGMLDGGIEIVTHRETYLECRFDEIWPSLSDGNSRIDGVKIDVQGMELEVLKGMRASLKSQKPIIALEFHHGVDREEVLGVLEACGYSIPGCLITEDEANVSMLYLDDHSYVFSAGQ